MGPACLILGTRLCIVFKNRAYHSVNKIQIQGTKTIEVPVLKFGPVRILPDWLIPNPDQGFLQSGLESDPGFPD